MRQYRKLNCEVQAFVADFELFDEQENAFEVEVSYEEWNGLSVTVRGTDGETLNGDEVARRFGFRDAVEMGLVLTEDITTDSDYETLRPLNAGGVTDTCPDYSVLVDGKWVPLADYQRTRAAQVGDAVEVAR